ncbi:hypothetical protein Q3G72_035084 [Acer saccharum]|nr:hypothetical protein Q3G72_035084 [Acer saccharum]
MLQFELLRREAEKTFSSAASLPSQKIGELDPQKRVDLIEATPARSDATATARGFQWSSSLKIFVFEDNESIRHVLAAAASGGGGVFRKGAGVVLNISLWPVQGLIRSTVRGKKKLCFMVQFKEYFLVNQAPQR